MNFRKTDIKVRIGIITVACILVSLMLFCRSEYLNGVNDRNWKILVASRLPLVIVNGQIEQLPNADYIASPAGITVNGTAPTGAGDIEATTLKTTGNITTTTGNILISNGSLSAKLNGLFEGDLTIGAVVTNQKAVTTLSPTVNHGTLSADASNFMGRISAIGANTSVTLTFGGGGFTTISHCRTQPLGGTYAGEGYSIVVSASNTAPAFNCRSAVTAGAAAANCPDMEYECWGN